MDLKFEDSEANEFDLSDNFKINIDAYERRINIQKRYGKDGGEVFGDQKVNPRGIKFDFENVAENDEDYIDALNDIIGFFKIENAPFYLVDTDNERRCKIVFKSLSDEPESEGLEYRIGKNRIDIEMLDSHWEDYDETIVSSDTGGMATGESLTVDNDADVECWPIIMITPLDVITEFTLRNSTTGAGLTIGSNSVVPGTELEIDCQNGTIYLIFGDNRIELSASLADGSGFIKLIPGENQIEYESLYGDIELDIEYRQRYPF